MGLRILGGFGSMVSGNDRLCVALLLVLELCQREKERSENKNKKHFVFMSLRFLLMIINYLNLVISETFCCKL